MIPDIEAIVEMLIAKECTAQQAIGWIAMHFERQDLRDHFAGQAVMAMYGGAKDTEQAAFWAYELADSMLKERINTKGEK